MTHTLYRWGRLAARRPWQVIGAWLGVTVLVLAASGAVGRDLEESFGAPGLDSQRAAELLSTTRAGHGGVTAHLALTPVDDSVTFFDSAEARADVASVQTAVAGLPAVLGTNDPAGALERRSREAVASGTVSPDGRVALLLIQYPVIEELRAADLADLKEVVAEVGGASSLRIEAGGDLFFAFEEPPAGLNEVIGLVAAMLVLLVAFGSFLAMGLPIAMALVGLAIGVGSMSLVTYVVAIPSWAPVMSAMVGLGVGIDYALLLVTRHREHLAEGMPVEEAVGRALATAGRAVVFAGGTVVVAILGLAVAGIPFVTSGGIAISIMVLVMVLASITLLPALLGLAGHRIHGLGARTRAAGRASDARWRRWPAHVARHAGAYAIAATVLLLAVASPVLALRLGFPDAGTVPESRSERRAYDLIAEGFGPGANGPIVIAVDISEDGSVVGPLTAAVASDPGVARVSPAAVDLEAGVAAVVAWPTTSPQDDATRETVSRLRSEVFPAVLDGSPAHAHVGGQTATFADLGDRVEDRLPLFVAAVVLLSFLLLVVLFRSVLVPLKAAILNLLSVGAAYGVLVMVFQWGWGADLFGLESTVPIVSFIPLFIFAILFGLSMDYEVFLLSRIREEYVRGRDNGAAVVRGLTRTARTITSAALIMISVFGGFVLNDDPVVKMMGLGLATAILVDATIVRMVLVPATMSLMGDANWWVPRWLDRLLPVLDADPDLVEGPEVRYAGGGANGSVTSRSEVRISRS